MFIRLTKTYGGMVIINTNFIKSINNDHIEFSDGIHCFDNFTRISWSKIQETQQEVLNQLVDIKLLAPKR